MHTDHIAYSEMVWAADGHILQAKCLNVPGSHSGLPTLMSSASVELCTHLRQLYIIKGRQQTNSRFLLYIWS